MKEREKRNAHVGGGEGGGGSLSRRAGPERLRFPKPLALSRDRVTGTTIHHRFAPYNPRAEPPAPVRPSPRLLARASSHRTLYGARTTLFVCFQPVCACTRRYAISVSGMCAAGRTTNVSRISVLELLRKKKKKREKIVGPSKDRQDVKLEDPVERESASSKRDS